MGERLKRNMTTVQTLIRVLPLLAVSVFHGAEAKPRFHPPCHSYYSGSIGSHAFTMAVYKYDTLVEGTYAYSGQKSYLTLEGVMAPNGHFRIPEYDRPENHGLEKLATGIFEGAMNGDTLKGIWHGKRPGKSLPFHATRFIPKKRKVLTAAIGEYRLIRAGGSMGANGMFGYDRENGKWTGVASSISGGQREGESASFTKEERRLLNSLKLLVHPNLDLDLVVDRDTLLHVPYVPEGMHYLSGPFDGNATLPSDTVYEPSRTFYEDKLALAYLDSADFSAVLGPLADNLFINVADRMRLDYQPIKDEFELEVGHDSFDHSFLTFGSRKGKRK